jgi:hypothetical protein
MKKTQWTLSIKIVFLTKSRAAGLQMRIKMVANNLKVTSLQIRRHALLTKSSGRKVRPNVADNNRGIDYDVIYE